MTGPVKVNDPGWKRHCFKCGHETAKPEVGQMVECRNCGHLERYNPWKDCPNRRCDGVLRANHSFTSGGYKTGRLGCAKCGSTANFTAKVETIVTPDTSKTSRPAGVIALMNELAGKDGDDKPTPSFFRFNGTE